PFGGGGRGGAVPVERARAEVAVLAIYSEDARHVARIKAALDGGGPVVSTNGWEQFEQVFPRAACSIAVVEWLQGSAVFPRLTSLSARFRLQPIVLVTSKDADNARALQASAGMSFNARRTLHFTDRG